MGVRRCTANTVLTPVQPQCLDSACCSPALLLGGAVPSAHSPPVMSQFIHASSALLHVPATHRHRHRTPPASFNRFGRSGRLRQLVNLVVVGGVIDPADTGDREERAECEKMHGLIKEYGLQVSEEGWGLGELAGSLTSRGSSCTEVCVASVGSQQRLCARHHWQHWTITALLVYVMQLLMLACNPTTCALSCHPTPTLPPSTPGLPALDCGPEEPRPQWRAVPHGGGHPRRLCAARAV
jgi:hypothetical protein